MNVVRWAPPPLQIWAPDLHRLRRLADSAENAGHPAAYFLLSELHRANPYDGREPPAFAVSVNSWVTFSIDDSSTVKRRLLVLPEDCVDANSHLSVLSPIGAALVGLPQGSRMPYVDFDGEIKVVTVKAVRANRNSRQREIAAAVCTALLLIIWIALVRIYK